MNGSITAHCVSEAKQIRHHHHPATLLQANESDSQTAGKTLICVETLASVLFGASFPLQHTSIPMNTVTEPSPRHVCRTMLERLDPCWGNPKDWRIVGDAIRAKVSFVFRARNEAAPFDVAVKIYDRKLTPKLVQSQADLLIRCRHELESAPGLDVPKVIAAFPEQRAILMEWIDAPSLGTRLREAGGNRLRRAHIFAIAGRWLGAFHGRSNIVIQPLVTAPLKARVDSFFSGTGGDCRQTANGAFCSSYEAFVRLASRFAGLPAAYASCHGDFNPNNLHHGGDRTVGIDFGAAKYRPAFTDVCRFLLHAETSKRFLTRRSTLSTLGVEQRDLNAFLSAYTDGKERFDQRMLAFIFLSEVIHRWATIIAKPKGRFHAGRLLKHLRLKRLARAAAAAAD